MIADWYAWRQGAGPGSSEGPDTFFHSHNYLCTCKHKHRDFPSLRILLCEKYVGIQDSPFPFHQTMLSICSLTPKSCLLIRAAEVPINVHTVVICDALWASQWLLTKEQERGKISCWSARGCWWRIPLWLKHWQPVWGGHLGQWPSPMEANLRNQQSLPFSMGSLSHWTLYGQ